MNAQNRETQLGGKAFDKLRALLFMIYSASKATSQKYYAFTESQADEFIEAEYYIDPELILKLLFFHIEIGNKARVRCRYRPVGFIDINLSNL